MKNNLSAVSTALGVWGVMSVVFGLLILAWPAITVKAFLVVLGVYLLASGATMLIGSLVNRTGHWVGGALIGILSLVTGIYVFAHPTLSALAVLTVIAIWSIAVGVLEIVAGFEAKPNNWLLVVSGVIYTLFGMYVFSNPKNGALAIIWLIGLSIITSGIVLVVGAFQTNKLVKATK
jgi:uncharacterized membrane protein HdeD (DUF308 family)